MQQAIRPLRFNLFSGVKYLPNTGFGFGVLEQGKLVLQTELFFEILIGIVKYDVVILRATLQQFGDFPVGAFHTTAETRKVLPIVTGVDLIQLPQSLSYRLCNFQCIAGI